MGRALWLMITASEQARRQASEVSSVWRAWRRLLRAEEDAERQGFSRAVEGGPGAKSVGGQEPGGAAEDGLALCGAAGRGATSAGGIGRQKGAAAQAGTLAAVPGATSAGGHESAGVPVVIFPSTISIPWRRISFSPSCRFAATPASSSLPRSSFSS